MLKRAKEKQIEIIEKAIQHIHKKLPPEEATMIEKFVKQYYFTASPEDIVRLNVIDLYGSILSHWNFINQRQPNERKVRVYNPQFEQHGWQSPHSVVEIIQKDMPFMLDSIRMELNRRGLNAHLILHLGAVLVNRDEKGYIKELSLKDKKNTQGIFEAPLFIEFDRQSDPEVLESIRNNIEHVLCLVETSVNDWPQMTQKMEEVIAELENSPLKLPKKQSQEVLDFLSWLKEDHFTFLGYCRLTYQGLGLEKESIIDEGSLLGIFREGVDGYFDDFQSLPTQAKQQVLSKELLLVGKTNKVSRIHRPAHPDLLALKVFDANEELIELHCFIGLHTSAAYNRSTQYIPFLRSKVKLILDRAGFQKDSHDAKALINILETIPRDELFQGSVEELYRVSVGILYLQERKKIRLFIRKDIFCRYFSCIVFVPRERFNSDLRIAFAKILEDELHGSLQDFNTRFSESVLCRIHFTIEINPHDNIAYDEYAIQELLVEVARTWDDTLREALVEHFGEEEGNRLIQKYTHTFPPGYQANFLPRTAVFDIAHMETLSENNPLAMSFYRPLEEPDGHIRFKLFHFEQAVPLSDVIPMLESMGLRILNQRPHELINQQGHRIWINDFGMIHESGADLNVEAVKDIFQEAFYNIWYANAESDGFNRLVLKAGLNWQEVVMLRSYAKYLWQIGFTFSQTYIEETLAKHNVVTRQLVELFILRFDPTLPQETKNERTNAIRRKIKADLEQVDNLDEDRILRRYVHVIMATLRTNFFLLQQGQPKPYLSLKFDPSAIPEMPLPKPMYEVFVYSPRVEGVHLRGAKVARGGLRWSDRREDFRTEVLGLMKAQQVKNAVIVPLGAKGGFVPKRLPEGPRDAVLQEGIGCYLIFIRALLDITDNIIDGKVVPPKNVVRYDEDDPYLVVAADKGTATFSDIANTVSQEYGFWLDDAFASGGSTGYDHKKMGITARGAWESVKRHFKEMGVDTQSTDFTVVGIGDMSGDVFGNGMLLSEHIKLIGAFNHQHIFIDPDPDPKVSFEERKRLFNLERSSWADYNQEKMSPGGGIFSRSAKSIPVSAEMKALFGLHQDKIIPNELIRAILRASFDLLWNGGIGTYVKAAFEHNAEVGDRANDALRINGSELQCKVVGEGGNLGFTQLGRVEYALKGGRLNTDAIDNSAGVDCSDHEVNIKILLNAIVNQGDLTIKQRNELLESMTEEVAELVLKNNRDQTRALSVASLAPLKNINMYSRLISFLERDAKLDRSLEFLPDEETLQSRINAKQGLTRPELSVIFAYTKTWLKEELLNSDLPEDSYVSKVLETAFPKVLRERYQEAMYQHRLHREIVVMQVANQTINNLGPAFVRRLQDETGATPPEVIRCYHVAREVFAEAKFHEVIDALGFNVKSSVKLNLLHEFNRLIRRGSRWFLRYSRTGADIEALVKDFTTGIERASKILPTCLKEEAKEQLELSAKEYIEHQIPSDLAYRAAQLNYISSSLDIVDASLKCDLPLEQVMGTYFSMGSRLELGWFRNEIRQHSVASHWDALARAAFRDDLDKQQRELTISVLLMEGESGDIEAKMDAWILHHQGLVDRFRQMVTELKAQPSRNWTMYSVALRDLFDLSQAAMAMKVTDSAT